MAKEWTKNPVQKIQSFVATFLHLSIGDAFPLICIDNLQCESARIFFFRHLFIAHNVLALYSLRCKRWLKSGWQGGVVPQKSRDEIIKWGKNKNILLTNVFIQFNNDNVGNAETWNSLIRFAIDVKWKHFEIVESTLSAFRAARFSFFVRLISLLFPCLCVFFAFRFAHFEVKIPECATQISDVGYWCLVRILAPAMKMAVRMHFTYYRSAFTDTLCLCRPILSALFEAGTL